MVFEEVTVTEKLFLALESKHNRDKWVQEQWGATLDFCDDSEGRKVLRISGTRELVDKAKMLVNEEMETVDQA